MSFYMIYVEEDYLANYYLFEGSREEAVEWSQQPSFKNQTIEDLSVSNFSDAYNGVALLSTV